MQLINFKNVDPPGIKKMFGELEKIWKQRDFSIKDE